MGPPNARLDTKISMGLGGSAVGMMGNFTVALQATTEASRRRMELGDQTSFAGKTPVKMG